MDKELLKQAKENQLENFQIMQTTIERLIIETFNDKLEKFETSSTINYQISAIYQEKEVKLSTEYLDTSIIHLLKEQAEYLDIKTPHTRKKLENIKEEKNYQIDNPEPITKRMLNLAKYLDQYQELKEINSFYEETIIEQKITTEENELYDIKKQKSFSIEGFAKEQEKNSTSYKTITNIDNSDINMEKIAEETIKNTIDKLYDKPIENGTYQVILTSQVMGEILNKFIDLFSADSLQKETSLLSGKLETKVFSNKITMIEDPTNPKLLGKRLFDDTGKHTYYKKIVQNGIFKTPLYDERTAAIDKVESTGNDYGTISPRNMYIEPGTKTLKELIKSVKKGILIDVVGGLHAGINPINGNISIQSEGYYIENGQKKYATKLFVLSTNILDILNNVIDLSNNIEFHLKTVASPDILLNNIKISK